MKGRELQHILNILSEYKKIRSRLYKLGFIDESFILTEITTLNSLKRLTEIEMELKSLFPSKKTIFKKIEESKELLAVELRKLYETFGYEDIIEDLLNYLDKILELEITARGTLPLFEFEEDPNYKIKMKQLIPHNKVKNDWIYT